MMISLKDIGLIILFIAILVLIVYIILVMKNLLLTINKTNKILDEAEIIIARAAERVEKIDGTVEGIFETVGMINSLVKGNQGKIMAATNAVNGLMGLKKFFTKKNQEK